MRVPWSGGTPTIGWRPVAEEGTGVSADEYRPKSAVILVDLDNVHPPGSTALAGPELRHSLLTLITLACDSVPRIGVITVRLYGGWMSGGVLSRMGSEVAAAMAMADPFPLLHTNGVSVRGTVELATSLLAAPAFVLQDTYRHRGSVPRLRLSGPIPPGCQRDPVACPARILKQFTKGPGSLCPADACGVTATSAFVAHEQKMVDTLLSCDLLAAAEDEGISAVFLVSGDTDFVPPLLYAACRDAFTARRLYLLTPSRDLPDSEAELLRRMGVAVQTMNRAI